MTEIGLDIGTTTISAVAVRNGEQKASRTVANRSFLPGKADFERIQDPGVIEKTVVDVLSELLDEFPETQGIGVTGQQHGILYLNQAGKPVSPLYTWQDGRGEEPFSETETYAAHQSCITGLPLATGYGCVTHYYNLKNGLVPQDAVTFCTVGDYLAMRLSGNKTPRLDATNAASLGLFEVEKNAFCQSALHRCGFKDSGMPRLAKSPFLGYYQGKIPVYTAIGDNQASFLGANGGETDRMLVNVGTGSQFSAFSREFKTVPGLETRPFPGGYLLVGTGLCGGRAFALLETFFRKTVALFTGTQPDSCFPVMDEVLAGPDLSDGSPKISPLFMGTRSDPSLRGRIAGIGTDNFDPGHLIFGMVDGMAEELASFYRAYCLSGMTAGALTGSGNGLRKNPVLCQKIEQKFGKKLTLSQREEEAAFGAALFAAKQE